MWWVYVGWVANLCFLLLSMLGVWGWCLLTSFWVAVWFGVSDMLVVGLRVGCLLWCWYNIRIFTVLVLFDCFVSRFYVSYFWDFGLLIIDFLLTR